MAQQNKPRFTILFQPEKNSARPWFIYRLTTFLGIPIKRPAADKFFIDGTKTINGCRYFSTAHRLITEMHKGQFLETE